MYRAPYIVPGAPEPRGPRFHKSSSRYRTLTFAVDCKPRARNEGGCVLWRGSSSFKLVIATLMSTPGQRRVGWSPAAIENGGQRTQRRTRPKSNAFLQMPEGLTIERVTLVCGCIFVIMNVFVLAHYMPGHESHHHITSSPPTRSAVSPPSSPSSSSGKGRTAGSTGTSADTSGRARSSSPVKAPVRPAARPQAFSPQAFHSDPASPSAIIAAAAAAEPLPGASTVMARWLAECSQRPRCSCLQHGVGPHSEALFAAFPSVAFFVLLTGPEAQQLTARLGAANLTHVYVLRADLQTRGTSPMANDVLNPKGSRLTALQALRTSNEFFDAQIVHATAPNWLLHPTRTDARAVLALSSSTLLLLPSASSDSSWKRALEAILSAEGCAGRAHCSAGEALTSLADPAASSALVVELSALRRLNAHHYSCWHSPRCHQRMYVMDLPHPPPSAPAPRSPEMTPTRRVLQRGWQRRVPRLYRIEDGTRFGAHNFSKLSEAWALRGKDLGFDTGGMNLDTAIGLQLAVGVRARLAAQFLALPVGRDMMLWNIIIGRHGLYAIDQENHAFEDGSVPWGERVWPYCISVRDCYEKALGALCGRLRATQPLSECFAPLTRADFCPDSAKPFPCPNGCQASFLDCKRRSSKESTFVARAL